MPRSTAHVMDNVALVSRDWNQVDEAGRWDMSANFAAVNQRCDSEGCDTILYSPWTLDKNSLLLNHDTIFGDLQNVQCVVMERGNLHDRAHIDGLAVEVWRRNHAEPLLFKQRFATSVEGYQHGPDFLSELSNRCVGTAAVLICGETNLVFHRRAEKKIDDCFGVDQTLQEQGIQIILNPIHTYMRRYEMKLKRQYLSSNKRAVLSVWTQGAGKESFYPWTVYFDGHDATNAVRDLDTPFEKRPDIRIGVLNMSELRSK